MNLNPNEEEGPPISWVQDEVLCIILSQLDAMTLMIVVPQVCKFWRSMCQEFSDVHLDFRWWWRKKVPLEVLTGWRVLPALLTTGVVGGDSCESGCGGGGAQQKECWVSGICALFPHTTSITMCEQQEIKDAHLLTLAAKCRGLTHVRFNNCLYLTDAAVVGLADKCRGLTHAEFWGCDNLTDAAVLELADKCRGLTHVDFIGCWKLTGAAVRVLADKCLGLIYAFPFAHLQLHDGRFLLKY